MAVIKVRLELSHSRSKKHAYRELVLLVQDDEIKEIKESDLDNIVKVKPVYSKGNAIEGAMRIPESSYIVILRFVRNPKNRVKGLISIYDDNANLRLEVKYLQGKIRKCRGDPLYGDIVLKVLDFLKIPYRSINLYT